MTIGRIVEIGKNIWSSLTEDERDNIVNDCGTFGYTEHLCELLGYSVVLDIPEQVEYLHDRIFGTEEV